MTRNLFTPDVPSTRHSLSNIDDIMCYIASSSSLRLHSRRRITVDAGRLFGGADIWRPRLIGLVVVVVADARRRRWVLRGVLRLRSAHTRDDEGKKPRPVLGHGGAPPSAACPMSDVVRSTKHKEMRSMRLRHSALRQRKGRTEDGGEAICEEALVMAQPGSDDRGIPTRSGRRRRADHAPLRTLHASARRSARSQGAAHHRRVAQLPRLWVASRVRSI